MPTLTFVATANAVVYVGARPVFVDSERAPGTSTRARRRGARRGARRPTAAGGGDRRRPLRAVRDWDPILEVCERYGVPVIEDAAEALGATYRGRAAGSFGALSVFSFNGNKIITTSGGGMLVGDDAALIERARHLATQRATRAALRAHRDRLQLPDEQPARGGRSRSSRPSGEGGATTRDQRAVPRRVRRGARHRVHPERARRRAHNWLTVITIDDPTPVREHLESLDIEARPAWKPMHLQPVFASADARRRGRRADLPHAGSASPAARR